MVQKLLARLREDEGHDALDVHGFYTGEVRDDDGKRCGFDIVRVNCKGEIERVPLARTGTDVPPGPKIGKYTIDVMGFDANALPMIRNPPLPRNPMLYTLPDGTIEAVSVMREEDEEEGGGCTIFVPSLNVERNTEFERLSCVPDGWIAAKATGEPPLLCVCDEVGKMELLSLKFPPSLRAALDRPDVLVLGTLPQAAKGQRDAEFVDIVRKRDDVKVLKLNRNNRDALFPDAYASLRANLNLGDIGSRRARVIQLQEEAALAAAQAAEEAAEAKLAAETALMASPDAEGSPEASPAASEGETAEAAAVAAAAADGGRAAREARLERKRQRDAEVERKKAKKMRKQLRKVAALGVHDLDDVCDIEAAAAKARAEAADLDVAAVHELDDDEGNLQAVAEFEDLAEVDDVDSVDDVKPVARPSVVSTKAAPISIATAINTVSKPKVAKLGLTPLAPPVVTAPKRAVTVELLDDEDDVL